jgi:hypothetical protein
MKLQSMTRAAILVAALAGPAVTAPTATAADDHGGSHHCPAGFEPERAQTGEERAADRNDDGTVCVRESDDGDREIRDDIH